MGERFHAGFPFDAGVGGAGVLFWEFTAPLVLDSGAVGTIFKVPQSTEPPTNGPGFTLCSDIDELLAELFTSDAPYTESAMRFMTPPDASNLSELREKGARIMVYHGVSDPIFSIEDTEAWFCWLGRDSGGPARTFARLYPVPGMGHCSGGPSR